MNAFSFEFEIEPHSSPHYRLREKIETANDKKLIVVSAAAGSGKSSVVRDIYESDGAPYFWYNLHSSENTTGFLRELFAFLRDVFYEIDPSAYRTGEERTEDELLDDLARFLRQTGGEKAFYVILDDYHRADGVAGFSDMTERVIPLFPRGAHVILVSDCAVTFRAFHSLFVSDTAWIGQEDFLLGPEETERLMRENFEDILPQTSSLVYDLTEGWLIGVLAVIKAVRKQPEILNLLRDGGNYQTFVRHIPGVTRFIQERVFMTLPENMRDALLALCVEGEPDGGVIRALAGGDAAGLEALSRRCLLFECVDELTQTYHMNRCFRSFLYQKAKIEKTDEYVINRHLIAARVYESRKNWHKAFHHYVYSLRLNESGAIFKYIAFDVMDRATKHRFGELIKNATDTVLYENPWVQFCYAVLIKYSHPNISMSFFDHAIDEFRKNKIREGFALANCQKSNMVIHSLNSVYKMRQVIADFENEKDFFGAMDDPIISGYDFVFAGIAYINLENDGDKAEQLLNQAHTIGIIQQNWDICLWVYYARLILFSFTGNASGAEMAISDIKGLENRAGVQKFVLISAYQMVGWVSFLFWGKSRIAEDYLLKSIRIADALEAETFTLHKLCLIYILTTCGRLDEAEKMTDAIETAHSNIVNIGNAHLWPYYNLLRAYQMLARGNSAAARDRAFDALRFAEAEKRYPYYLRHLILCGAALRACGQHEEAARCLAEAADIEKQHGGRYYRAAIDWHIALNFRAQDKPEPAGRHLKAALSQAAAEGYMHFYGSFPAEVLDGLADFEAPQDIKTHVAEMKRINREMSGSAPDATPDRANKAFEFGLIGVFQARVRDGEVRKIKSVKALYLLKMLLVAEAPISVSRIIDELWSHWDADLAMKNLYYLLHQIRKYLGSKDSVQIRGGICWMDKALFSTDVQEFDREMNAARRHANDREYAAAVVAYDRAVELVRGEPFEGELLEPVLLSQKVWLDRRIYNLYTEYGALLIKMREFKKAVTVIERATLSPFVDEDAYKLLMAAHYLAGNRRGAVLVFDSLCLKLKQEMNLEPHAMTLRLLEKIKAGQDLSEYL